MGVITRIKANLSSTELGLTSQLELSLAKILVAIICTNATFFRSHYITFKKFKFYDGKVEEKAQ